MCCHALGWWQQLHGSRDCCSLLPLTCYATDQRRLLSAGAGATCTFAGLHVLWALLLHRLCV
jgi:hypothetical protein